MFEKAVEVCEKGVRHNPFYTSGYVVQGKCFFDMGATDASENPFLKALNLDENNLVALKYLGMIFVERGEAQRAREKFKHILALDPDNKEIMTKLEALREEELPAEPVRLREVDDEGFEGATITLGGGDDTSNQLATVTLADIYASQGYKDKAIRIYREVLDEHPSNELVQEKLAQLEGRSSFATLDSVIEDEIEDDDQVTSPAPVSVTPDDTPGVGDKERPAAIRAKSPEDPPSFSKARPLDESQSYEHFKRWVKKIAD